MAAEQVGVIQQVIELVEPPAILPSGFQRPPLFVCCEECRTEAAEKVGHGQVAFAVAEVHRRCCSTRRCTSATANATWPWPTFAAASVRHSSQHTNSGGRWNPDGRIAGGSTSSITCSITPTCSAAITWRLRGG